MNTLILLWTIIVAVVCVETETQTNFNETIEFEHEQSSNVLSRRKRFLVFPDGSSFQLVFEHQNHGYLQIGNIVWFSNTAALAWELPTDPQLFYMLKKDSRLYGDNHRRQDTKHIYYLDEDGKVLNKVPYHRKFLVNPAMGKRSIKGNAPKQNNVGIPIKEMHAKHKEKNHFQNLDEGRLDFHRSTRKDLYEKIETFLESMGWNGDECVLRMLCESGKNHGTQGTFIEEIVKATFTLPQSRQFDSQHKYDIAHGTQQDCAVTYPECVVSGVK